MIQSYGNPERRIRMANKKNSRPAPAVKAPKAKVEQVKVETVKEPDPADVNPIKATVFNCKKVRVRKSPSTAEDNIITELDAGTEVVVLDSSNPDWTKVAVNGINEHSWIMSEFLQPI